MREQFENGILTIYAEGRVDSTNAQEFGNSINEIISKYEDFSLVIDAENLEYISSAGLRVILRVRKDHPDLKIVGVNSSVYEILDMTGFTDMIKVEKAYKTYSVEGCEILGEGANGIVYKYDNDTVIKVYKKADALAEIHREREFAKRALILGIPTAISYDVAKVGDHYGSVFELLNAKSFSKLIQADPDSVDVYVKEYVDLLKQIHSTKVEKGEFEDAKEVGIKWVEFCKDHIPFDQYEKLKKMVCELPDTDTMIHGDYHINNVEKQNGETLLIDMDTLSSGHPIFELEQIYLSYVGFGEVNPKIVEKFMKLPYDTTKHIWKKTMELYFDTTDEEKLTALENKIRIIGYVRMLRRTIRHRNMDDPEAIAIVDLCKEKIAELLEKVDSLDF